MDCLQLRCAGRLAAKHLTGKKLQAVQAISGGVCLHFGKNTLLLRVKAPDEGLWISETRPPETAHPFANLLQQTLPGMTLSAIDMPYPDRIVQLRFEKRHLSGQRQQRSLVAEWLGNRSNLILLEDQQRMRYAWRWDEITGAQARVLPQQPYQAPAHAPSDDPLWMIAPKYRKDLSNETLSALAEQVNALPSNAPWLKLQQTERSILYPIALPGWQIIGPADFVRDWPLPSTEKPHTPSAEPHQQHIRALQKTLAQVNEDIQRWQNPERYRRWAQALHTLPNHILHQDQVEAIDYYAEPPEMIRIPVLTDQPLHQQAEHYFKQARRAARGLDKALQRQQQLQAQLKGLLEQGISAQPSVAAIRKTRPDDSTEGPLRIDLEGYEILVGRNARQNDEATFKLARPWDIWLHVQDYPGAHVIIRMPKSQPRPPDHILAQAAALALRHSPRAGHSAEIAWTQVRFVSRKPKGGLGEVLYRRFQTWRVHLPEKQN